MIKEMLAFLRDVLIEKNEVVTNCDYLANLKFAHVLPIAYTGHSALMLGNVLKSDRAIPKALSHLRGGFVNQLDSGLRRNDGFF